ncbi:DUF6783 domain-containing protein [Blautia sp. HCP3S3_H10_2]|uniref:DUF6783 domain-containing protein n=1 Tax=Blautia sp. HCP3S3_H10_2 TaxID=3438747 RepID=UPI003F917081
MQAKSPTNCDAHLAESHFQTELECTKNILKTFPKSTCLTLRYILPSFSQCSHATPLSTRQNLP